MRDTTRNAVPDGGDNHLAPVLKDAVLDLAAANGTIAQLEQALADERAENEQLGRFLNSSTETNVKEADITVQALKQNLRLKGENRQLKRELQWEKEVNQSNGDFNNWLLRELARATGQSHLEITVARGRWLSEQDRCRKEVAA